MEEVFIKYGLGGTVIVALAWFILKLMKDHKKERQEWKQSQEKHYDKIDERQEETNRIIRENTNILSGLKTLLENRK